MRAALFGRISSLALIAFSATLSCSGDKLSTGNGGSGATGSGGTGGGPVRECPLTQPVAGTDCTDEGLYCTFGSDPRPKCRTHIECKDTTVNIVRQPSSGDCPQLIECSAGTGVDCSPEGDECGGAGQYCACTCVSPTSCTGWTWKCPPLGAGCAPVAPNHGARCNSPGLSCSYGVCDGKVRDRVVAVCNGNVWEWTEQCLP